MNVLSLFDGIGGARVALDRAGIVVDKYYTSEINKFANAIFTYNYPDHIKLGDIENWRSWIIDWGKIDLIIGGSPCTNLSVAGRMEGLKGEQSRLFYDFVDILNFTKKKNPDVYFILENVVMKKEWKDTMTSFVGVEPIMIDSALVSAQRRRRLYWTNIPNVSLPKDRGIVLKDVLAHDVYPVILDRAYSGYKGNENIKAYRHKCRPLLAIDYYKAYAPSVIKVGSIESIENHHKQMSIFEEDAIENAVVDWATKHTRESIKGFEGMRYIYPTEAEELQTYPKDYTRYGVLDGEVKEMSTTQRFRRLGNSFTVDVIAHILSVVDKSYFLPEKYYNDIKWNNTRVKNNTIRLGQIGSGGQGQIIYSVEGKSICLTSKKTGMYKIDLPNGDYLIRKLMPIEAERLQTFPDDYTRCGVFDNEVKEVSKTQRLRALGNSFTVDVISHILSFLKSNSKLTLDKYIV